MTLNVLAAGSLKPAFVPLLAGFSELTGIRVEAQFGPAGLLRERIEAGVPCSLFASANVAHPQALLASGRAQAIHSFAGNRLNITARRTAQTEMDDWLTLLADPSLRLGTSTPGCDPSGDYTWQLFDHIERERPGLGEALKQRAQKLVGGRDTLTVPAGEIASAWLIREGLADLFIGYRHYALALGEQDDLRVVEIPAEWNIYCEYQMALLDDAPATKRLAQFILGVQGQRFLRDAGFLAPDVE
jgi:molybdate transport system substrate-binding protein